MAGQIIAGICFVAGSLLVGVSPALPSRRHCTHRIAIRDQAILWAASLVIVGFVFLGLHSYLNI